MMNSRFCSLVLIVTLCSAGWASAQAVSKEIQDKVDVKLKEIATWAADPAVVQAVKEQAATQSDDYKAMTQEKWKSLPLLDPFIRSFTKNAAATFLKSKKSDVVIEMFLSMADGKKVAFLSKPSNWSHAGKPKHDDPMSGKTWQGPIELDESTGIQEMQVAVPVMDGGKAIGSLVVGMSVSKMKE